MKKFFAMLVVAAMLASLCALTANAAVDEADWNAFGEVKASYVEDLSTKIHLDGDVSDWQSGGFERYDIDKYNLDAWVGEVDENWSINMWFSADAEYLYVAFKINDDVVALSDDSQYNGDAFQIQLDFNGWAAATEGYERAVFYSFGLQEDNTVDMTVQCIESDAGSTTDYYMASDDEVEFKEGDVKGATKAAEDGSGWYAEFAVSWQTLYRDIVAKLDKTELPEWTGGSDKVSLNMLVCYIDRDTTGGDPVGAWATSNALGAMKATDETCGWYPENSGMTLTLEGMEKVTVESITEEETEPDENTTEDKVDDPKETDADTDDKTDDATTAPDSEQATDPAEKKGCGGIIGAGAIVAVLALGACVVAKKKD